MLNWSKNRVLSAALAFGILGGLASTPAEARGVPLVAASSAVAVQPVQYYYGGPQYYAPPRYYAPPPYYGRPYYRPFPRHHARGYYERPFHGGHHHGPPRRW